MKKIYKFINQKYKLVLLLLNCFVLIGCRNAEVTEKQCYVETDFITLSYPIKQKQYIEVEIKNDEEYIVEFWGKIENREKIQLFDIIFEDEKNEGIGKIEINNDSYISIDLQKYEYEPDDTWEDYEIDKLIELQNIANYVLEGIPFVEHINSYIETKYGKIEYPEKYKDEIYIECVEDNGYTVSFYGISDKCRLFDIYLESSEGEYVGKILDGNDKEISVSIKIYDLNDFENEKNIELQEIIRYIINNMNFLDSSIEIESSEDYIVETPYTELLCPYIYSELVNIKTESSDDLYTVSFYSNANEEEYLLFEIYFGKNLGDYVGNIEKNGKAISVSLKVNSLEVVKNLSESEMEILRELQSGSRYIVNNLQISEE